MQCAVNVGGVTCVQRARLYQRKSKMMATDRNKQLLSQMGKSLENKTHSMMKNILFADSGHSIEGVTV